MNEIQLIKLTDKNKERDFRNAVNWIESNQVLKQIPEARFKSCW